MFKFTDVTASHVYTLLSVELLLITTAVRVEKLTA